MKVCAHYNLGPFDQHFFRAPSMKAAVSEFRDQLRDYYGCLEGIIERTGDEHRPSISLYPQCDDCSAQMCFHDYPMAVYSVGPRNGIGKETI